MNPEELLVSNLGLLEELIGFVCRRHALCGAEAEDFASLVKLKLVENDYAVLKRFEGKSTLGTYLGVVVHRFYMDYRKREWGRWRPTYPTLRAGSAAVLLEAMVCRDGIEPEEALQRVLKRYPDAPRDVLGGVLERSRHRIAGRPRVYSFAGEPPGVTSTLTPERDLAQKEREAIGARVTRTLRTTIESWPPRDQLIVRMRYADELKVATIARLLQLDQKALYRHLDRLLRSLRNALVADGLPFEQLRDLLEGGPTVIELDLEKLAGSESSEVGSSKEDREDVTPAYGERETA